MFVVRRTFRGPTGPLLVGSVIEPTSIRDFKYRVGQKHIVEVTEQNFDRYQKFFKERFNVDITLEVIEEKVEEVIEEKAEEVIEEKVEEVIEEKAEEVIEEKVEEVIEEKAEEVIEEKVEEVIEEKAQEEQKPTKEVQVVKAKVK